MRVTEYTIVSSIDGQHIKSLKDFDREMGNPFNERYQVIKEEFDYD